MFACRFVVRRSRRPSVRNFHPLAPMAPKTSENDPIAFAREGWRVLVRHRHRALVVFLGVLAIAVVGALLLPRKYESSAKLLAKIGRESVTLDPTATVGETVSVFDSRETEVNTILEILDSRAVLEDVARDLGPATILGRVTTPSKSESAEGEPSMKELEQAVRALQETTSVARGRKSNVVSVTARAATPELAQRTTSAIIEAFGARYRLANRTAGSFDFFETQERLVAGELAEATNALNTARNDLGVTSVEGERVRLEGRLTALDVDHSTNAAALAAATARIDSLRTAINGLPETRVTQQVTGFAEDAAGRTRQQLYVLRLEEHDLLTRYAETHPDVEAVRERIERAERTLAAAVADARNTQTTTVTDPNRSQLELELLRERSNAESLRGRLDEIASLRATTLARLQKLNAGESTFEQLARRVERLRADHREYATALEQARIDRALADEHISNVNVFQPPSFEPRPVGSSRRLVVLMGLVLATLSAIGVAFGTEYLAGRPAREVNQEIAKPTEHRGTPRGTGNRLQGQLASSMAR